MAQEQVCFSPPVLGGCDPLPTVVDAIRGAQQTVLVQIYALTSDQITDALIDAKRRGRDVRVIVDRRRKGGLAAQVRRLATSAVPVLIDTVRGLMHNKVMIIDGATVLTGSFNYTDAAERRNAENLVVIRNPTLVAKFTENWNLRAASSQSLDISSLAEGPQAGTDGPVRGNRHSKIYQWPGCPSYDAILPENRVEFASAQDAKAAGYRPAKNCR